MPSTDRIDSYRNAYLAHTPSDNFDREIWQNLNILSTSINADAKEPKVYFSITIPQHYSNHRGTMYVLEIQHFSLISDPKQARWSSRHPLRRHYRVCFEPPTQAWLLGWRTSLPHSRDQVFSTCTIGRDTRCCGRGRACGKKPCNHQGPYQECEEWRIIGSLSA